MEQRHCKTINPCKTILDCQKITILSKKELHFPNSARKEEEQCEKSQTTLLHSKLRRWLNATCWKKDEFLLRFMYKQKWLVPRYRFINPQGKGKKGKYSTSLPRTAKGIRSMVPQPGRRSYSGSEEIARNGFAIRLDLLPHLGLYAPLPVENLHEEALHRRHRCPKIANRKVTANETKSYLMTKKLGLFPSALHGETTGGRRLWAFRLKICLSRYSIVDVPALDRADRERKWRNSEPWRREAKP